MKQTVKEELVSKFVYECGCGCGELRFEQWKDEGIAFINYMIPAWYASEYSGIRNALRVIWAMLRGKEHFFYEITIEDNETLERFKKFVADMTPIQEDK